jgi:hypothetical protein
MGSRGCVGPAHGPGHGRQGLPGDLRQPARLPIRPRCHTADLGKALWGGGTLLVATAHGGVGRSWPTPGGSLLTPRSSAPPQATPGLPSLTEEGYGESTDFIEALGQLELPFVLAIREHHGVWMPAEQQIAYTAWQEFDRGFSDGEPETRWIREILYGERHTSRYYQITTEYDEQPPESTWFLMTDLPGDIQQELGNISGVRTWIEYGFKQSTNELGWADFRLTMYPGIERWWEIVSSAYLMVSLQSSLGKRTAPENRQPADACLVQKRAVPQQKDTQAQFQQHKWWNAGTGWKATLNNLRLISQPYVSYGLIIPWLQVFLPPFVEEGFEQLIACMNHFKGFTPV